METFVSDLAVFPFEFLKKKETVFIGVSALSGSLSFSRLRHQGTGTKLYPNSIQEYIKVFRDWNPTHKNSTKMNL